ncbi:MAG: hypothetical protein JW788_01365 [Candidatus Omnitrophica bacterium]|nr:hypothetical protein [Candidatus Omnitrophota bacterium]
MKIKIILIVSAIVLMILVDINLLWGKTGIDDYTGENILYLIKPIGESEYNDLGTVDLEGVKVNLVTLRTKILFFEDTEKIYSDIDSLLPRKVERNISSFWAKEYITEEYDQKKFTVTLKKFKRGKIIKEQITQANGPIHNAIALLFRMCRTDDLKIGWQIAVRMPRDEFKVELVSIDAITISDNKVSDNQFQAYHFKSIPENLDIWVNKDSPRIPLKIQGKGIFNYVLSMKKYSLHSN